MASRTTLAEPERKLTLSSIPPYTCIYMYTQDTELLHHIPRTTQTCIWYTRKFSLSKCTHTAKTGFTTTQYLWFVFQMPHQIAADFSAVLTGGGHFSRVTFFAVQNLSMYRYPVQGMWSVCSPASPFVFLSDLCVVSLAVRSVHSGLAERHQQTHDQHMLVT